MKHLILLISFNILIVIQLLAQAGKITGTISGGHQNSPLEFAAVQIEGTALGTSANKDGYFEINNVPAGKVVVKARSMGYQTFKKEIEVLPDATTEVDIDLQEDNLNLNEVVVSGTRYAYDRKEAPVVVNVLDEKLFNAAQAIALSEGLNYQPGVRVETNCQNCGFTQVRLNGLEGGYSQILINSRPVFSALNSVYGLDQIPTNIIEKVEVVRSGGSALYGSNAIAGTINIITKEPILNTWQIGSNFALIDGDAPDNTVNFNGSVVSEDLMSGVTFYGMFRNRDHYDANEDGFTEITTLENNTFGTKAFLKPGNHGKLTLDLSAIREYRRGGNQLDLAPHFTDITEELDHNTFIGGLTYEQFSKSRLNKFTTYISAQKTGRGSYYGGLGGGRTASDSLAANNAYGNTDDLAIVGGFQFTRHFESGDVITTGIENQYSDVVDEIPGYNRLIDQQVNTIGLFGQYEWKPFNQFTALIGARYDYAMVNGQYKIGGVQRSSMIHTGVLSPRLTALYDITENIQFRGGYARGFRAPQAFNEDLHISSVGGEPQFVILADELETELSDAYTASLNFTQQIGDTQTNLLLEGFYTDLKNPFTIVSTGSVLPNGSILEEVRNGTGAYVTGANFELKASPAANLTFQAGGTAQNSLYEEDQVLYEPETPNENESTVQTDRFMRNPNFYGYLTTNWSISEAFGLDLTSAYTGPMIVPRVVSSTGFLSLEESDPFMEINLKATYHIHITEEFHLEVSGGVQNIFNSYQDDFDTGPERDSDYIYGPSRPRTYFVGLKIGNLH